MKTETWKDLGIIAVLIVCLVFVTIHVSQEKADSQAEWINHPKLFRDCSKISVVKANQCAELDSVECFERCLK